MLRRLIFCSYSPSTAERIKYYGAYELGETRNTKYWGGGDYLQSERADGKKILRWNVLPSGCGCTAPLKCGLIRILCGDCCWLNWDRLWIPLVPGWPGGCTKLSTPKWGPPNPCCSCCGWMLMFPAAPTKCGRGPPTAPRPTNTPLPRRPPLQAPSFLTTCLLSSTHTLSETKHGYNSAIKITCLMLWCCDEMPAIISAFTVHAHDTVW